MADDQEIWSPNHVNYSQYPVSTYMNSNHLHGQPIVLPYNAVWNNQVGFHVLPPPYPSVLSTSSHVPPNVNPFSRYNNVNGLNSDNFDAEVSYYNHFAGVEPKSHLYDDSRCSSTDTTLSSSSTSTVFSHGSVDTDFNHDSTQSGQKRKKLKLKNSKSKKAKTENSNFNYKRWPKPPYSYCGMIIVAIQISPEKELTLQGIHATLMELFPFFRGSYMGWRDSVRHNLSHSPCFVKIPCIHPVKIGRWTVDWSKVTPAMFARQQSKISNSDLYKVTIHEHLGLEPYNSETHKKDVNEGHENAPVTPVQPKVKNGQSVTPQTANTRHFNVALPDVEKCENQTDSPYQFRATDFTPSQSEPRSSEDTTKSSEVFPMIQHSGESYPQDFSSFLDLIMSETRTSVDAVQHLHTLCVPVNQSSLTDYNTELPPHSRDSDVYLPMTPVKNDSQEMYAKWEYETDDTGVITISPFKARVATFSDSYREEPARGRLGSGSDTHTTTTRTDINEEEITILDI